jgi:hypothetical protein
VLSRSSRFLTLILAALQFAAPAIASVAEGSFSQQVADSGSHIEAYGLNSCTPPHSADCAICRFLTGNASDAPATAAPVIAREVPVADDVTVAARSAIVRYGFDSRAPPPLLG